MSRRGAIIAAGCVVAVSALGGGALAVAGVLPWPDLSDSPSPALATPPAPPAPDWTAATEVLTAPAAVGTGDAPMADVLDPLVADPELGGDVGVSVVNLDTGAPAYESAAATAQTPASTLKILTAAAVLEALGPDHTFTTRVVATAAPGPWTDEIVLVGAGDPGLTVDGTSGGGQLTVLADATSKALKEAGVTKVRLTFDDSLFTGPAIDPDWNPDYVPSDVVSPVSALAADVAETRPDDPALSTADRFAELLGERGVTVAGTPTRTAAPDNAVDVAAVESAPLATLAENMLAISDDDAAEVLARHVAIAAGLPGGSEEASAAVVQTLTSLGVDMSAATVLDGSGLARGSAVPAAVVADTLALAADPSRPGLRAVVTGLPVAGFTGTLEDRFGGDGTSGGAAAAGLVRAKTGTLTGVSALAGVVVAANGVDYAFALLADDVDDTEAAREALDEAAAAVAVCGCQ